MRRPASWSTYFCANLDGRRSEGEQVEAAVLTDSSGPQSMDFYTLIAVIIAVVFAVIIILLIVPRGPRI
jgi:hypothetical protein